MDSTDSDCSSNASSMDIGGESVASDNTDDAASMRSASPASVVAITSDAQFFREENGRLFNTTSDLYPFPADGEEMDRLSRQHVLLANILGYKYVPGMDRVLMPTVPGERKKSLDLGCGPGSWVFDVVDEFNCEAVGVDLIPIPEEDLPEHAVSEVDDINGGLKHFRNQFDVVHTRLIAAGIRDYHELIINISDALRSGGLLDLTEYDFQTYDEHGQLIVVDKDDYCGPWYARWLFYVRYGIYQRGGDVNAATNLYSWVKHNDSFEDVIYHEHFLSVIPPDRPKDEEDFWKDKDEEMMAIVLSFVLAGRTLLLRFGFPWEFVLDLESKVVDEILRGTVVQYTRLQCVYARRRAGERVYSD